MLLRHKKFGYRSIAAVILGLSIAACNNSGGSNIGMTPPSAQSSAQSPSGKNRHSGAHAFSGVRTSLLTGWAAAQASGERMRHGKHQHAFAVHPSTVGHAKRIERIGLAAAAAPIGSASALVLYDTAGSFGFLGELYAMATANLAGHFGTVTTEPVSQYTSGQMNAFTATIYIGSTYYDLTDDQVPPAFYADAQTTTNPLVWMGDNIWNYAFTMGAANFENEYGWDPTSSYFAPGGSVGNVTSVSYKSESLTRSVPAGDDGGILHPAIMGGTYPAVTTVATAVDTSTTPATTFPWAIRSGNLTYIGEIPFEYVTESDRIIAFEDMLYDALAPTTPTRHRAMFRLEDMNPNEDTTQLMQVATYLANNKIPYGFNVIPWYQDPNGYYNNGVPVSTTLAQAPAFVTLIKYMLAHGGVMIDEGYTHQYSNVANPYSGVSGDDAEFFLASVNSGNYVVWNGPVPNDSLTWAQSRVRNAVALFKNAGVPEPVIWVTPHYFATDVDYEAIAQNYLARYERSIYFNGLLVGGGVNHASYIGEFFPYVVDDVYGTKILPENLGDYEPVSLNNNPIRMPADIINEAQLNLAVRDGFASFFYDPTYGVTPLQQTIQGIKALGYTFTAPASTMK